MNAGFGFVRNDSESGEQRLVEHDSTALNSPDRYSAANRNSRFCEHCEIVLELHPSGRQMDDQWECNVAIARLRVINAFLAPFVRQQ